jgi:F0F1-type ATP synthase assembly protein I
MKKSFVHYIALITELGIIFILPILLFTFIGAKITAHFSYPPGLILVFIFLGLVAGFYNIYRTLKKLLKDLESE